MLYLIKLRPRSPVYFFTNTGILQENPGKIGRKSPCRPEKDSRSKKAFPSGTEADYTRSMAFRRRSVMAPSKSRVEWPWRVSSPAEARLQGVLPPMARSMSKMNLTSGSCTAPGALFFSRPVPGVDPGGAAGIQLQLGIHARRRGADPHPRPPPPAPPDRPGQ